MQYHDVMTYRKMTDEPTKERPSRERREYSCKPFQTPFFEQ